MPPRYRILPLLFLFVAGVAAAGTMLRASRRTANADTASGRLLVGLRPGADATDLDGTLASLGARIAQRVDQIRMAVIEVPPQRSREALARLRANPAVRYAAPDRASFTLAAAPNDPRFASHDQWYLDRIGAPAAWDLLPPAGNTIVAVLDTGIDYRHPEFAGQISPDACDNFYARCTGAGPIAKPQDNNGHGTFVAGIIGAATNNRVGIASVTEGRVTLLPIKVLSKGGGVVEESTIVTAIVYAVDHGAKVVNMSFGGPCGEDVSEATRDAIGYAEDHDVLLVMAAGNSGGCREGRFPQNDSRVLSVAATDFADKAASFTDLGPFVGAAAPGVDIVSTLPLDLGSYGKGSGTSFAAPQVSGEAALLFQVPGATKPKVMDWILKTCDSALVSDKCGGRINVFRALSLATKGVDPGQSALPGAASPTASPTPQLSATPAPVAQQVSLAAGCNNVTVTWPDGTTAATVAAAVSPADALVAIWKYDTASGRFLAFSPAAASVSDLTALGRLDAVLICMRTAGTLARPPA